MAVTDDPRPATRADGRVPPYDLEAEESLLGAMLLSKDAIVAASELGVSADDFYKPVHAHIFDAITSLYSAGEPADPVTVADELRRAGLLGDMGGPGPLVSLQVRTPATSSAARYARIVSEHALLRRLIAVAGEIAEMGYRVPDDVAETVDRAEAMVFDVAQHRVSDSMAPIRDLLDHSLTRLEMLYEKGDAITGIPTGYRGLDELLSGLQPSSLVIVGARPATGKCITGDTLLTDPRTGARVTMAELHRRGRRGAPVEVLSLGGDRRLHVRRPSAFVDDGLRPVFEVRTHSGRVVRTTASHPFLTPSGWRPLAEIAVGTPIAVPRAMPVFGHEQLPEVEVVLLAYLLSDGAHTGASVRFTTGSAAVMDDLQRHARSLGAEPAAERGSGPTLAMRLRPAVGRADRLVALLADHGLAGTSAYCRSVPDAVFRLPRAQLALFLNRLLGADGSAWWSMRDGGSACLSYCSVSPRLASDVAHLLLRFGINARLRRRVVHRRGWRGPAHELEVTSISEIRRLAAEIGMYSKDAALANLLGRIEHQQRATASKRDPGAPDDLVEASAGARTRSLAAVGHAGSGGTWSGPGPSGTAPAGTTLAGDHGDVGPGVGGSPAVAWDHIVAIDATGQARVYDLTVPGDHNFVAADIFVHNTAFALGMAAHAALEANRPVLFFSLEMSHLEITQRLLASEARVDSTRMRNGRLAESDWTKISHAIGRLAEAPIYIDDNPRATVLEIRAKSRRLKSRLGDLGMVVVDYLQLMTGRDRAENRQVEVSEISRGLKVLARELQTPVVALSQLSRGLELRADKRPMLADLRESGCLSADARVLRCDTGTEVAIGELCASGEHGIPVWTLDRHLEVVPGTMTEVWMSGHKRVHELRLASGRRIKASSNHPFLTVDGWLRLDELRPGSEVAVPSRLPAPWRPSDEDDDSVAAMARAVVGPGEHRLPPAAFALPHGKLVDLVARVLVAGSGGSATPPPGGWQRRGLHPRLADELQLLLSRLDVQCRVGFEGRVDGAGGALISIVEPAARLRFVDLVSERRGRRLVTAGGGGTERGPQCDDNPPAIRTGPDVAWDAVVSIDTLGVEAVFDATVAGSHNFIANGIVVENSLEQDADVVIFLYRDEIYHPESPDRGTAEVLVAKHRSGPTGMERLAFLDHYTRFANMAKGFDG